MDQTKEVKPIVKVEEKHPFGQSIKCPIILCARNLPQAMYPLMIHLCYFCQKSSSDRDCFVTDAGKMYFSVQMCTKCIEYNKGVQKTGVGILQRHLDETRMAQE